MALLQAEEQTDVGGLEVKHRSLSEVPRLLLQEKHSIEVNKCIYERQGWPARNGGLEQAFIEWASADGSVLAFCKISETRHTFARLRYVKDDGLPAFYSPDFLLRTADAVYLVETKAQRDVNSPNVQRKLKAAQTWCERINALPSQHRSELPWHYVLLGEEMFKDWRNKGARLAELLAFARVRPVASPLVQGKLDL